MISRCEALQAWLESVTYQMCNMAYKEQASKLAGYVSPVIDFIFILIDCDCIYSPIAFLKQYSTRCARETAQDAVQIFGGRGITQSGMGKFIEHVRTASSFFTTNNVLIFLSSIIALSRSTRYSAARRTC